MTHNCKKKHPWSYCKTCDDEMIAAREAKNPRLYAAESITGGDEVYIKEHKIYVK